MKLLGLNNPFGAPVYHEECVSSTFDAARVLAGKNEGHGTVIAADFQEAGRGRLRRSWAAEKAKNLLFTILLRYGDFSSIPEALTLRTGFAVSLAVEDFAPVLTGRVWVKWPNDIMIYPAGVPRPPAYKAAGILTESGNENVFIGVGVNVSQTEFPEEYRSRAGSIVQALPEAAALPADARFILLEKILARLYSEIGKPEAAASWRQRLSGRLYKKGETVTFAEGAADSQRLITGTLSGIGPGGELLIIPGSGHEERAFVNGELRVY